MNKNMSAIGGSASGGKKIIASLSVMPLIFSLFAFAPIASAAAPNWDIRGTWTFNDIYLGVPYVHTMVISSLDPITGAFSGTGFYNDNPALTWTVTGTESGDVITVFNLLVTAVAPGVTIVGTGTINSSSSMSGTGYQSNLPGGDPNINWTATRVDSDHDGVWDGTDLCPNTIADIPDLGLGTNRWKWDGTNWMTLKPKASSPSVGSYTLDYTYGCSGEQILAELENATGKSFEGHYKYGVSKSIIEDWHAGRYYLETVTIPASDADGVSSLMSLLSGQDYIFKASGNDADACLTGCGYLILFDPEYSTSDYGTTWVDGVAAPYTSYGPNLLDLMVNGGFVDWDNDAVYNPDHTYWYDFVGTGAPVSFGVYDVFYPNNTGNLTVDIYADLW